ncbi:MAG: vanadium-dependent haloperoxidase [Thiobacillus sp.]
MDTILFWNDVAMEVHRRDFDQPKGSMPEVGGPTRVSRAFAIVHASIYNAWTATTAGLAQVYAPVPMPLPPPGLNPDAAVAGAAIATLRQLWPKQTDYITQKASEFYDSLVQGGIPSAVIYPSSNYGEALGLALVNFRRNDGSTQPDDNAYIPAPPRHQADPMAPKQARLSTHWGDMVPFAINGGNAGVAHAAYLDPHPGFGTPRYAAAVADVKENGRAMSVFPHARERTPEETVIGTFWGYDGSKKLGVPPRLYNQVVRAFMQTRENAGEILSSADRAKLFALVHLGMADAAIVAWGAKYHYDLWRPVIGIRQHDLGYGPNHGIHTSPASPHCDPFWLPLGAPRTNVLGEFSRTPDFPAYPSGHATFGAVSLRMTALFYADKFGAPVKTVLRSQEFTFVSDEFDGVNQDPRGDIRVRHARELTLAKAIVENALSRVYLGVHWRFDGLGTKAPAGLEGEALPADPANGVQLTSPEEKKIGGVPAGLKIADEVFAAFP